MCYFPDSVSRMNCAISRKEVGTARRHLAAKTGLAEPIMLITGYNDDDLAVQNRADRLWRDVNQGKQVITETSKGYCVFVTDLVLSKPLAF